MKKRVEVTVFVNVEIDESKFDEEFIKEFRQSFYPFYDVGDHLEHLAQLEARGLTKDFIEGYGPIKDMGIKTETIDWTTCVEGDA